MPAAMTYVLSRPKTAQRSGLLGIVIVNVELHLRADRATRYETVAETMSAARRAGLAKIGFVTQPAQAKGSAQ
jgi:biopolymer transport protein ExbD